MPKIIYNPDGTSCVLDSEIQLALLLVDESRLARAFLALNAHHDVLLKRPERRAIDDDFIGWIAWDEAQVPEETSLQVRFTNGEVIAERTLDNVRLWGKDPADKRGKIVAYRLVPPTAKPPYDWAM